MSKRELENRKKGFFTDQLGRIIFPSGLAATHLRKTVPSITICLVATILLTIGSIEKSNAKQSYTTHPTTETGKLLAPDGAELDQFGFSVSISNETAIVGAFLGDANTFNSGSAFIFANDGTGWTEQAKLEAADGAAGDRFGISVSVSGDTAIIGAYLDDDNGSDSGSAYIFAKNALGLWTQQAKILASDGAAGDWFGEAVSISGDTAIVGARKDDDKGSESGSAYIFVRTAGVWAQQDKLTAFEGAAGDEFGFSVGISENTVIAGAQGDDNSLGSAYIFVRAGTIWTEQAKLAASDGAAVDRFGWSVSISGDTAIVGAPQDDDNGTDSGSAYIFVRDGIGDWSQQAKLIACDAAAIDLFGISVSISVDKVIVGVVRDDDNGLDSGSAHTYVRNAGAWNPLAKLTAPDGAEGHFFGFSVSISGDTAIIGAPFDDNNGFRSGSAYIDFIPSNSPNSPPVADADMDQTFAPTGPGGAQVTLDGSLSSDLDGDTLTYSWDGPFGTAFGVMPDVTIPLGTHVVTLTVDDGNCHTSTDTVTVAVLYNFTGFFDPIDNVQINVAQAGRGIPIKFSLNGDKGVDILAPGFPLSLQIPCLDEEVDYEEIPTVTAGNSSLSYDPVTDQYNYVWKTSKEWKGMCRRLVVKLNDGSIHTADFQFK